MHIWKLEADPKYQYLIGANGVDLPITVFLGKSYIDVWQTPAVELSDDSNTMPTGDFFLVYSAIACTLKARNLVNQLPSIQVEFLPIKFNDEILYAINVMEVIDCLDYKTSEIEYFESGNIRVIRKYMFKSEYILNKHIFKIPERLLTSIFVSETFKSLVEQAGLKGITFIHVWEKT